MRTRQEYNCCWFRLLVESKHVKIIYQKVPWVCFTYTIRLTQFLEQVADRVRANPFKKISRTFLKLSKVNIQISKPIKFIFICILKPHKNRKTLSVSGDIFYNFSWIVFFIINSKMNKHSIYRVYYNTEPHPFWDIFSFPNKAPKLFHSHFEKLLS